MLAPLWLSVVLATPAALKLRLVAASAPALVLSVRVAPLTPVAKRVHGLLLSAQALTVTVLARQARLLLGNTSS